VAPFELLFGDGFPFPWFPDVARRAMNENPYTCPEVLARLDGLLEGDLVEREAAFVGAHLQACGSCRAALRVHEGVSALLSRADSRRAPLELRRRVIEALLEEDRRRPD
jgi:predicted anti-sigma-YlaC factor YlaD